MGPDEPVAEKKWHASIGSPARVTKEQADEMSAILKNRDARVYAEAGMVRAHFYVEASGEDEAASKATQIFLHALDHVGVKPSGRIQLTLVEGA